MFFLSVLIFMLALPSYEEDIHAKINFLIFPIVVISPMIAIAAFLWSIFSGWRSIVFNVLSLTALFCSWIALIGITVALANTSETTGGGIILILFSLAIIIFFSFVMLRATKWLTGKSLKGNISGMLTEEHETQGAIPPEFEAFINDPIVTQFIGKNFEHYKEIWTKDMEGRDDMNRMPAAYHLNWLALLVSCGAWFGYRKMYRTAFIWLGALIALNLVSDFTGLSSDINNYLFPNLMMALWSKSMYMHHTWDFYKKNKNTSRPQLNSLIQEKGGVSIPGAIMMMAATPVSLYTATVFGDYLFHR